MTFPVPSISSTICSVICSNVELREQPRCQVLLRLYLYSLYPRRRPAANFTYPLIEAAATSRRPLDERPPSFRPALLSSPGYSCCFSLPVLSPAPTTKDAACTAARADNTTAVTTRTLGLAHLQPALPRRPHGSPHDEQERALPDPRVRKTWRTASHHPAHWETHIYTQRSRSEAERVVITLWDRSDCSGETVAGRTRRGASCNARERA